MTEQAVLSGYVWFDPRRTGPRLPDAWRAYFARQTLPEVESGAGDTYRLLAAGLPDEVPRHLPHTLVEEMTWALLSRPGCDVIVYPLHVSTDATRPASVGQVPPAVVARIASSGFLALCRHAAAAELAAVASAADALASTATRGLTVAAYSRALLAETTVLTVATTANPVLRRARVLRWITSFFRRATAREIPLGRRKAWASAFPRPTVHVRVARPDDRVPIWIAMHWLELGGAEKFALDLVRALPRDRFAVHVTTDVPSENTWTAAIRDHVEEVLHLPSFLPSDMIAVFCEHFVRTRNVQLLHIHHAPRVYESLFHLRRFHPDLRVVDTLHILELPPHAGGYPEWAMRSFGAFIDHHHVVSEQLRTFLMQRWLVPAERIDVVRANVDAAWFDPALVAAGELRRKHGIPDGALVVGFIARFTSQKRPLEFVRLAAILSERWRRAGRDPALHFLMVGSGTLLEQVKAAIHAARLQDVVHLTGELADTRPAYRDCDVVAMPSANEGLALVTYEAMAMATPIFFSDVGAQSELLGPDQLVDPDVPVAPALADRLWPYLLDPQRRRALGDRQRAHVVRHHPVEETFLDMVRIYDALLESRATLANPAVGRRASPSRS